MTTLIVIAVILSYVLTVAIVLYIIAKDGEFDTVGELCGWTWDYYGIVFIPVINTLFLIVGVLLFPVFKLIRRIADIKLRKEK